MIQIFYQLLKNLGKFLSSRVSRRKTLREILPSEILSGANYTSGNILRMPGKTKDIELLKREILPSNFYNNTIVKKKFIEYLNFK